MCDPTVVFFRSEVGGEAMSEEKEKTAMATGEKPADDKPAVDLAMQNEQTVAQTNAINDAVKAAQVGPRKYSFYITTFFALLALPVVLQSARVPRNIEYPLVDCAVLRTTPCIQMSMHDAVVQ